MEIVWKILPIFLVILIGYMGHHVGFVSHQFLSPANKLVFYLALPALVFRNMVKAPFEDVFNPSLIVVLVSSHIAVWLVTLLVTQSIYPLSGGTRGTFILSSVHGNFGYVALAVSFYVLGDSAVRLVAMAIGFLGLTQNILSVVALTMFTDTQDGSWETKNVGVRIASNPLIAACFMGLFASYLDLFIPHAVLKTLEILGGMALPVALLIIGAELSPKNLREEFKSVVLSTGIKLCLLPFTGIMVSYLILAHGTALQKGVIIALLAAPSATVTPIMAGSMGGNQRLASAAVTLSTLLCMVTYTLWFYIEVSTLS